MGPQTLLVDADDTLWENNIYFERAIAEFISYLDHQAHSREQVRECLNACETESIRAVGYGLHSFERSLVRCFEELTEGPMTTGRQEEIRSFAQSIAEQEIELLPDVEETLASLAQRHQLLLVTKGHPLEQIDKLERSGLRRWFTEVEVLQEKDEGQYRALLEKHRLDAATSWMVGNSPKSDINPALAAGLHAVFVPHRHTWVLEHTELAIAIPPQKLVQAERFADLKRIFAG
jgi:putative hydrolase of the HAD superfamily